MWKWFPVPVNAAPHRQLRFWLAEIKGTFRARRQRSGQKPLSSLQGSNKQAAEQMYEFPQCHCLLSQSRSEELVSAAISHRWQNGSVFSAWVNIPVRGCCFFFYHSGMCSNSQHCIATTTDRLNDVRIQISPFVPNCRLYIKVDLSPPGDRLQKKDLKPLITTITIILVAETIWRI